jgi:hypothetical protein
VCVCVCVCGYVDGEGGESGWGEFVVSTKTN